MSITLRRITLREIELDLVEPFRTSTGVRKARHVLLLEAEDADGVTAWSECVAFEDPGYLPETIVSARHVITHCIVPRLLGHPIEHPRNVHSMLGKSIRGNQMARAAVEMAVWAIAAEKQGQSLARYLGGSRPAVAAGLAVGMQPTDDELVDKVRQAVSEGYHRIKLKIGPGRDIAPAKAVCEAVSGDRVMLDANSAYSLDDLETFRKLDTLGLMMIEQPLAWDDVVAHAAMQRELQTPICLDESLSGLARVQDMAALGSGRIVSIKPGRVGGLAESIAIHDYCVSQGIPVWCGGMLETGIGRAYNVALASLSGFSLPGDLSPSRRYWKDDIVTPPWNMGPDGMVDVPLDRPGLGVDIDSERIDRLAFAKETFEL